MNHYIDFNKVHELAMVVTQRTLQCFYVFIALKNMLSKMRPKAQKPNEKACLTNNITLSHHLLTLSIIHECLELLLPAKFQLLCCSKCLVEVSIEAKWSNLKKTE